MRRGVVPACLVAFSITWGGPARADGAPARMYVGSKKCAVCHLSVARGAQYKIWADSRHARAFEVLASPRAKEIAKAQKVADPQKSKECLPCHVTGYGKPAELFAPSFVAEEGVGCESCHGPAGDYSKMSIMQGIRAKKLKADDYGLIMPTKESCAECHNEKGTGGKFVHWPADSAAIAHPIPPGGARVGEGSP